jgi:pyruvate kinase
MNTKKTKIVATIGPVSANERTLTEMVRAGLDVIRINFSHGDFKEHEPKVVLARQISEKLGKPIAVMQDLSGPKFRIGDFYQERVQLKAGELITLTPEKIVGDEKRVSINYPTLSEELKVGNIIMIDDGKKKFEVVEIKNKEIVCKIIVGGETKGRRSVNLPGAYLKISSLTDKDKKDLEFGFKHKVDLIAFSFVRRAEDVQELRDILKKNKSNAMIIAKIETQEAVENFDAILELSDGVMVARGDLAVEIPAEEVPIVQKMIIKKCHKAGKPVITATQMLESMIKSPVPTRAEVSDVANAIFDGTDAIMLSEETTLGDYPVEAVRMMTRIAVRVEGELTSNGNEIEAAHGVADAVSQAVVHTANYLEAQFILALTQSGFTARMISRYRPTQTIVAFSPNAKDLNKMVLSYGVHPVLIDKADNLNEVLKLVRAYALKHKFAQKGDRVVIAGGMPFGKAIDTNMMTVEVI